MRKGRQEVLARMREVKKGQVKRTDQYSVKEEAPILQEMTEDEYQRHVEENKANRFIVDDFGIGYDDHGEFDLEAEYDEPSPKKPKLEGNMEITKFMQPKEMNLLKKKPKKTTELEDISVDAMYKMLDDDQSMDIDIEKLKVKKQEKLPKTIKPSKNKTLAEQTRQFHDFYRRNYQQPHVATNPVMVSDVQPEAARKRAMPGADEPIPEPAPKVEDLETYNPDSSEEILNTNSDAVVPSPVETPMECEESTENTTSTATWEPFPHVNLDEPLLSVAKNESLPIEEDGSLLVYWLDAFEDKEIKQGSVFVIGKVWIPLLSRYESICVIVSELMRTFYLLKRDPDVTPMQINEEIEEIRRKVRINKWSMDMVDKYYAFEKPDVPGFASYARVQYSSKFPALTITPGRTFSHVFGTHTSLIEILLTQSKMKGPSWLKLKNVKFSDNKLSNCRHEVYIDSPSEIEKGLELASKEEPPISVLGLSMKCFRNDKQINEICMISGVLHKEILIDKPTPDYKPGYTSFSIVRPLDKFPADFEESSKSSKIDVSGNEKALLNLFLARLQRLDPDMIVGHDLTDDFLEKLVSRIEFYKISSFGSLGKLIRRQLPARKDDTTGNGRVRVLTCGRLLCDTFASCKELIRESNYNLTHLAKTQLDETRAEIDCNEMPSYYSTHKSLIDAARLDQRDAYLSLELMMHLNVIPLTKQLTVIAGNLWVRSLQNARAERNEMLLIHDFYHKNYIIPDKEYKQKDPNRPITRKREKKYAGGLVLEPKAGLYDKYILLLDFNSLYPSIIREKNICFTTVRRDKVNGEGIGDEPDAKSQPGILPQIIKTLVDRRKNCKNDIKKCTDPIEAQQLEIKQSALKLTANSMYGCLGFTHSRFYAKPIAALITKSGRDYLEETVKIARDEFHLDVIYGDTDSIMINTNAAEREVALKIGQEVKSRVNKKHKCLEIEIDGLFKTMLLLKKKKYAVIKDVNGNYIKEVKGLDMVRRDWCGISKTVCDTILDFILSDTTKEEAVEQIFEYLENVKKQLDNNEIALSEYIITKQLTKPVAAYGDIKSQPHVIVAKKLQEQGHGNLVKHFIPYVIVQGTGPFTERARHPDDLAGVLDIDKSWYIAQQIIPTLLRLCKQIEGVTASQIADCLGQDPKKYESQDVTRPVITKISLDNFKGKVDMLVLTCKNCATKFEFSNYKLRNAEEKLAELKVQCPQCSHIISQNALQNLLFKNLRLRNQKYHRSAMKCSSSGCAYKSGNSCQERCSTCKEALVKEYSLQNLHDQLIYYKKLMSPQPLISADFRNKHVYEEIYSSLTQDIQSYLNSSSYQNLDTRKLQIPRLELSKVLI
jgi:DNA polymerase alpha subunit A